MSDDRSASFTGIRVKTAFMLSSATSLCLVALLAVGARAEGDLAAQAPLLEGVGIYSHPLASCSGEAQPLFDQGLRLFYGFYFPESLASFQEAARLDPDCAMAHWGAALAIGPNPNSRYFGVPDDPKREGLAAIRQAMRLAEHGGEKEQAYVEALWKRYDSAVPKRRSRDRSYADAMRELYDRFPGDPEAGTLYAESLMILSPWDYFWPDGSPRPGTSDAARALERVMEEHPDHPGAIHYYIHLIENSQTPERALGPADALEALMPMAGHIVHMPSHIYIRTGQYAKAIASNRRSLAADEAVVKAWGEHPFPMESVTYPLSARMHPVHAHDFLHMAAVLQGSYAEAFRSAQVIARMVRGILEGNGGAQRRFVRPLLTQRRFGKWEAILSAPVPETDYPFVDGIGHFVRGSALAATGDFEAADEELALTRKAAQADGMDRLKARVSSARTLLTLAGHILAGEIAARRGDKAEALAHLETAIRCEDGLEYMEPPDWGHPARHALGRVLMDAGRFGEAETVYWEDLRRHPESGWALHGLWKSLLAQGKRDRAAALEERFRNAWARADVSLSFSGEVRAD